MIKNFDDYESTYFSIRQIFSSSRFFDEEPKRLTLNLLNQLIDSPQTLANLQNYRETGNEDFIGEAG